MRLVLDEMTDGSKAKYSELLYQLANGANRDRLNSDGSTRKRLHWRSQSIITGNTNIANALVLDDSNATAQQMRIFEISTDDFSDVKRFSDPNFVPSKMKEMEKNCGAVGDVFIKYLVNNSEQIQQRLEEILDPIRNGDCKGVLFTESQARFYRYHISCTLVAAEIMADLGVSQIDLAELRKFAIARGNHLVGLSLAQRKDALTVMRDILGSLADYTLITDHFGRKPPAEVTLPKRGPVKVRIVNSVAANANPAEAGYEWLDNTIIVCTEDITKYLSEHREGSLVALKQALSALKALKAHKKLDIALGVNSAAGYRSRCFILDMKVISPDRFKETTNEE